VSCDATDLPQLADMSAADRFEVYANDLAELADPQLTVEPITIGRPLARASQPARQGRQPDNLTQDA
jgi:hypothetical protein